MKKNIINAKEFDGGTVEDAIEKAVRCFGVSKDQLAIRVVCEETKGLFGMEGAKPAKIKVSFKEKNKKI